MNKDIFLNLAKLFNENGFRLYMIGGTTRDYLLGREVFDYDFVSDATPIEIKNFLPDGDYTFSRFGSVRLKNKEYNIDITTLRIEGEYKDYRHPSKIIYVKDIELDYKRRDFTINAIYIDENFKVYDFADGINDLNNKIIRFIGDPITRVKEDPLRILRAKRFANNLSFTLDKEVEEVIKKYEYLLKEISEGKIKEELSKFNK